MPELATGVVLADRYVVQSEGPIAEGTYASVYRAVDSGSNGRLVAIKVESPSFSGKRSLLRAEANILRFMQRQPGIPALLDFHEDDPTAGCSFLVLELLGEDLGIILSRARRLSSLTVAFVGLQMLRSLQALHRRGLVHRDVKPNNFLLGRGNRNLMVHLIDFGLSRRHLNKDGTCRQARSQCEFRGTTRYASVRAHQNEEQGRADDLWSLVFSLLEMCTGCLPWNFYRSRAQDGLSPSAKAIAKRRVLEEKEQLIAAAREQKQTGYLKTVPGPIVGLIKALDGLGYEETPNYNLLVSLLQSIGNAEQRKHAAQRELPVSGSDKRTLQSLRRVWSSIGKASAGAAPSKPAVKRRLPTEEATTADTRASKTSRAAAATASAAASTTAGGSGDATVTESSPAGSVQSPRAAVAAVAERHKAAAVAAAAEPPSLWWQLQLDRLASATVTKRSASCARSAAAGAASVEGRAAHLRGASLARSASLARGAAWAPAALPFSQG